MLCGPLSWLVSPAMPYNTFQILLLHVVVVPMRVFLFIIVGILKKTEALLVGGASLFLI